MTSFAAKIPDAPVADVDEAETFAESDVTVTHNGVATYVESGSIVLNDGSSTVNMTEGSSSSETEAGITIVPNQPTDRSVATTWASNGTWPECILDGPDISPITKTNVAGGDTLTFESMTLSAGTEYRLYFDDGGDGTTRSVTRDDDGGGTPFESSLIDVTGGWMDGGSDYYPWGFASVESNPVDRTNESFTVEWPMPPDIYDWDVAMFQRSPAEGAVSVYIEENQSGTWTEIAGPIQRGDSIPADKANNVRYRIDISRPDTSTNPSLDAIYRRIKL